MSRVASTLAKVSVTESNLVALGLGSAWTQFGLSILFSFLRYALLFRYVSQADLGLGILLMTGLQFLFIFDSMLAPGITTEVGRAWNGNLPADVVSSCRWIYRKALIFFFAASVVALPIIIYFARDYGRYPLLLTLWMLFAARAALGFVAGGKFHVLTGTGMYFSGKVGQIASDMAGLATLFIALVGGLGVLAIGVAGVAEGAMQWIIANWFFQRRIDADVNTPPSAEVVQRLKESAFALLGNSLGVFLIYHTDNFFLARYVGLATVADYSIAYKLAFLLPTFCNPFYNAIYPRFVNAIKDSDRAKLREFFQLVRLNHLLAGGIGLGIIFLGRQVIDIWVGPGHFIGISVVGFMVATFVLDNIHYPHGYTFMSKNRTRVLMYSALCAGLLNLVLTAWMAPRYGAVGIAAGTFLAQLVCVNVLLPVLSLRALNYGVIEYLQHTVLPAALIWGLPALYWLYRTAPWR